MSKLIFINTLHLAPSMSKNFMVYALILDILSRN